MKSYFSDTEKNNHIKEYLKKNLAQYGGINYAYAVINKRNTDDMVIISDLPDYFTDVYLSNKYQNIDPVVINSLNRFSPLIWDDNLLVNSQWQISKIFESVKPYHDIISGQTFILHDANNNMALLSLYINKFLTPDINTEVTKNRNDIQGLLIDVHEMLLHFYDAKKDSNTLVNELTFREAEILHWSSQGKTYQEVACILNITVSTVKFHMSKIVKKFGVKNAKHAIRLSAEVNINPNRFKNK
ncbi:hypothetical protein A8A01_15155 [Ewingella americana]|nr:hypothetical protein A8A01_15155 [Ewingella americana]